jgi:ankyrin repeat protein
VNATGPHPRWGGRPQPIHVAIESDAMDIFQLLLDAGADPSGDSRSYDGWSPLMLAIHWKRDEMRDELLRRGAKVGLFEALMLGDDAIVRALLKSDPDVLNQPVPNGGTPLHFARTRRAVKLLLDAGVSPLAKDKYGRAPADVAVSKSIAHLLAKHGAEVTPQIMASLGDLAGLKNTISRNRAAVVDAEVLHRAVDAARIAVVRWLLDQGVDVNVRTVRGSKGTPLHSAAFTGNLAMVRLLLRRGADVAAIDGEHKTTPAVWARTALKMFNRQPCLEVAEYLENLKRS